MDKTKIREVHVTFEAGGVELEGIVARPVADGNGTAIVLLAPHPAYGGDMHNNVVAHLARRAAEEGCVTLRFNFGGVGKSEITLPEGMSQRAFWSRMDESQDYSPMLSDALGAYSHLSKEAGEGTRKVVLGYSLGSVVGGLLAKETKPDALIAISPPVSRIPMDFYQDCPMPKRFVYGENDFACAPTDFQNFYGSLPGEKSFQSLPNCDHFFPAQEEELFQTIRQFLSYRDVAGEPA